jgi:hypothetical protein
MSNKQPGTQPVRKGKQSTKLIVNKKKNKAASCRVDSNKAIAVEVNKYKLTSLYIKGCGLYDSPAALDKFNRWVDAHINDIDPNSTVVCLECGNCELILCEHHLKTRTEEVIPPAEFSIPPVVSNTHFHTYHLYDSVVNSVNWPKFDMHVQNNRDLMGFSNSSIAENNIIPELYNYIKLKMQSDYMVNGTDRRPLRLEHCRRLATKWVEQHKLETVMESDTVLTNRVIFTIQRVCDNRENVVLYEENDPGRNFLTARLLLSKGFSILLVCFLLYSLYGTTMLVVNQHRTLSVIVQFRDVAVQVLINLLESMMNVLLTGNLLLLEGLITNPLTVIVATVLIIGITIISRCSISRTR